MEVFEIWKLPYTINHSGYYKFPYSIKDANEGGITINANNVILDGCNQILSGDGLYGIHAKWCNHIFIKDFIIKGFKKGVFLDFVSHSNFNNIKVKNTNYQGISLWGSYYNNLSKITTTHNEREGLSLYLSYHNTFLKTASKNNKVGARFYTSFNNSLSGLIKNNSCDFIISQSENNTHNTQLLENNNLSSLYAYRGVCKV